VAKADKAVYLVAGGAGIFFVAALAMKGKGGRMRAYVHNDSEMARFRQVLPEMQERLLLLEARCRSRGFDLYWGDAFRSEAAVKATVAKGASAVKTASWHESRRAIDAYCVDPTTNIPDKAGKLLHLYRAMHEEWHKLGGNGLAFKPYPSGPVYKIQTVNGPKADLGHLEWRGNFKTALAAKEAFVKAGSKMA